MPHKNKLAFLFVFLIISVLVNPKTSNLETTANAQNETNPQIHEAAFNSGAALSNVLPSSIPDKISISSRPYKNASQTNEGVLIEEGSLDQFVYLPIIYDNYVYVFDDFSNPNSGFPNIDTSFNTYQYVNGEYQILNKTSNVLGAVAQGYKLDEFEYEISMRRVGSAKGSYGIVYWLDDTWSNYAILMITPDTKELSVYSYQESTGYTLRSYTNCDQINTGNGTNQVRMRQFWEVVEGVGFVRAARATVNEYCLISLDFGNSPSPDNLYRVGFFATSIDANHQVHFDNYLFKNYCVPYPTCIQN